MAVGCLGCVEPAFQGAFRRYGRFLSTRRSQVGLTFALAFLAVGFGIVAMRVEVDPLELRISQRGRIRGEKAFFEDRFDDKSPDTGAFIIEPREAGANLLAPGRVVAALDEVADLQEWLRTFVYAHDEGRLNVTLEDICYRPVGLADTEPCFQYSILDCFAEGAVFAPGGASNTEFADLYSARPSYSDFDFAQDFTEEYVRRRCVQWFNLGTADTMFLGSPGVANNSRGETVVDGVRALRVVFGTKSKERLARDGLARITFTPDEGGDSCLTSSDCARCVAEMGVSDAAAAGCTPSGSAQTEGCCEFMAALREAPCAEALFQAKAQVESLGNLVFGACGIPPLVLEKRCANKLAIRGVEELCACADNPASSVCGDAVRAFVESGGARSERGRRLRQADAGAGQPAAVPDVCVCLADPSSTECADAGFVYTEANPDALPAFLAASQGDEGAMDQVEKILVADAGCPPVCTCLGDGSSTDCRDAGLAYASEVPSAFPAFLSASQGDAEGVEAVRTILIEDVGCPVPGGREVDQPQAGVPEAEVPEVCMCLTAEDSQECRTAGLAYAGANPAVLPTFLTASQGDEAAGDAVGDILVNDAGCPAVCRCLANLDSEKCAAAAAELAADNAAFEAIFAATRRNESAVDRVGQILRDDAGCPDSDEDVCVCLSDGSSPECGAAAVAYGASDPDALAAFLAAAPDEGAIKQAREFLQVQVGCPLPLSATFPTVALCTSDPSSAECMSAVMDLFTDAVTNAAAMEEVGALLEGSLINGVQCPSQAADSESAQSKGSTSAPPTAATLSGQRQKFVAKIEHIPLKDEDEAWDIVDGWEHAWRKAIEAKVRGYKTIKVSWFSSTLPEDLIEDAAEAQAPLILGGYGLVVVYMIFYFMITFEDGKPAFAQLPPGPFSAVLAFIAIIVAVFGTFGIIGLVSLTDLKISPITPQVVPLLMVGLGINDFFVMASALRVTLATTTSRRGDEIMGETMAKGGTSITLSSLSNTAAFALGALSPVPAIEWFSVHMAIGVVVAYLISVTTIPCILAWALDQHLLWLSDAPPCCAIGPYGSSRSLKARAAATAAQQVASDGSQKGASSGVGWFFKRALHSPLYRLLVLGAYAGWLAFSVWGITKVERGLNLSETVPRDSNPFNFFSATEEHFNTFPVYVVFRGDQDFSDLAVFNESRATEFAFVDLSHNMDRGYKTTSFMNYYTEYVESKFCADAVCMDEVEWYWDSFHAEEFASVDDKLKNKCFGMAAGESCARKCEEHCPQGPPGSEFRCRLSEDGRGCYCPWRPKLRADLFYENPEGYTVESFWTDFLNSTSKGGVSQSLVDFDGNVTERNKFGKPIGVRSIAFVEDVPDVPDILEHIQSGRAAIGSSAVDAFPFDFLVYGIGEQYESITKNTGVALGISIVVAAVVMMPLIVHWLAAVLVTLCVASAVVIGAGMVHWIGLQLNYTSFVALIVSVGLSVEFCSHITRDFMLTEGDRADRAYKALKEMGLAVMNGGVTTLLSLIPVAFSEYPYFREYFFLQYSLVVAIGLFVGLIVLPVLLATLGPKCFTLESKPAPAPRIGVRSGPNDSAHSSGRANVV